MYTEAVKTKKNQKVLEIEKKKTLSKPKSKRPIAQIITVLVFVILVFGYIAADIFIFDSKGAKQVIIVNEKIDDLNSYLNERMPAIDEGIAQQSQQLQALKDINR